MYWNAFTAYGHARIVVANYLYWHPRTLVICAIAWGECWKPRVVSSISRWRLIQLQERLKLAWLGYGNHRVFERFELRPLPPPRYFQPTELLHA